LVGDQSVMRWIFLVLFLAIPNTSKALQFDFCENPEAHLCKNGEATADIYRREMSEYHRRLVLAGQAYAAQNRPTIPPLPERRTIAGFLPWNSTSQNISRTSPMTVVATQVSRREETNLNLAFRRVKQGMLKAIDKQPGLTAFDRKAMKERISNTEILSPAEAMALYPTEYKVSCGVLGQSYNAFTVQGTNKMTVCPGALVNSSPGDLYGVVASQLARQIDAGHIEFQHAYRGLQSCLQANVGTVTSDREFNRSVGDFWASQALGLFVPSARQLSQNFSYVCEPSSRAQAFTTFPAYRSTMHCPLDKKTCDLSNEPGVRQPAHENFNNPIEPRFRPSRTDLIQ
jgi:hypothetical protein